MTLKQRLFLLWLRIEGTAHLLDRGFRPRLTLDELAAMDSWSRRAVARQPKVKAK